MLPRLHCGAKKHALLHSAQSQTLSLLAQFTVELRPNQPLATASVWATLNMSRFFECYAGSIGAVDPPSGNARHHLELAGDVSPITGKDQEKTAPRPVVC